MAHFLPPLHHLSVGIAPSVRPTLAAIPTSAVSPRRRQLLSAGLSVAVLSTVLGSTAWWLSSDTAAEASFSSGLGPGADIALQSLAGFSLMGQKVREEHTDLRIDTARLSQQLAQKLNLNEPSLDSESFSQALAAAIQQDFQQQRLRSVAGWQLSETEALLAALRVALISVTEEAKTQGDDRAKAPIEAHVAQITQWGPRQSRAGEVPNRQSDGAGAFWFDSPDVPRWAEIAIDGHRLQTEYRGYVIVAALKGPALERLIAMPGEHVFTVHDDINQRWQEVGRFTVLPALTADQKITNTLCHINAWGPQHTRTGAVPNRQPDGSMGLWLEIPCVPNALKLRFGAQQYSTHFNGKVLTVLIPAEQLQTAGIQELALVDEAQGQEYVFGEFRVSARD